ncbi:MFS transporter [Roseomonas elaeocarpi]|uniref:MFS transporter n=1 Tax=Roseomonas elaeocarpi TaxID=907779 RepID=A0ABV6JNB3_9PROT
MNDPDDEIVRKLTWRLVPLLTFCYFVAILDRANVGVAALTMNDDLGLSASAFGVAAGIFFVPYVLLELPSNLALARFGARLWIARIMFTWGLLSSAHAFVWDAPSLYVARALLGAAEAGFVPGVIFYLTLWFPAAYRGRIIAAFFTGIPIALVFGTPVSGLLLGLDGLAGLRGWQWMYLLEGLPALLLAVVLPFILPADPAQARFLTPEERVRLETRLAAERREREGLFSGNHNLLAALLSPRVLLLCLGYYGLTNLNGAVSTFLPQILKGFGVSNLQASFLAAIPYIFGAAGMLLLGRLADRPGRRGLANYVALTVSALGLAASAATDDPMLKMVALCVTAFGVFGAMPVFWGLPTAILTGTAAAGGIALVNALGNLSSVVNPWVIGLIRDATGSFNGGLLWLALMAVMSILVITVIFLLWGRAEPGRPSLPVLKEAR